MVKEVKTKDEFDSEIKSEKLVIVDFFADWCGPCKMIAPKIEEFEKQYTDCVFIKVNVDTNFKTAESQGISAMPTFKFYKNGEELVDAEVVGASEAKLEENIKKNK